MLENLSLLPMKLVDLEKVYKLEQACHPQPWSWQMLNDCLQGEYACHCVWHQQVIIGYIIYQMIVDECHILNVAVDPAYQGQGMGTHIIKWLKSQLQAAETKKIFLEVRRSNHTACKLYSSQGFRIIGERKNYYATVTGREDALVMIFDFF